MGFGNRLARGLAGALQGIGGGFDKRAEEKRQEEMLARQLAEARNQPQSPLGKMAFDIYGQMQDGQRYTPEQMAKVAELQRMSSWGPQSPEQFDPAKFASIMAAVQGIINPNTKIKSLSLNTPNEFNVIGSYSGGNFVPYDPTTVR